MLLRTRFLCASVAFYALVVERLLVKASAVAPLPLTSPVAVSWRLFLLSLPLSSRLGESLPTPAAWLALSG